MKQHSTLAIMALGLFTFPFPALADVSTFPGSGFEHMWAYGMGGMSLWFIFCILLIVLVIVLIVRCLRGDRCHRRGEPEHPETGRQPDSPMEILKTRYAKGEIEKEEFEERRSVLGNE